MHATGLLLNRLVSVQIALLGLVSCATVSPQKSLGAVAGSPYHDSGPCRDARVWGSYLHHDREAAISDVVGAVRGVGVSLDKRQEVALHQRLKPIIQWRLIRFLLLESQNHNFGELTLKHVKTTEGRPLVVFRTGLTSRPAQAGSCVRYLLERRGVRHVINLYNGDIPTADLERDEAAAAKQNHATYFSVRGEAEVYREWRHQLEEHPNDPAVRRAAMKAVALIINERILRRGQSAAPDGNVHVHCGGGMHRTGMVLGAMDKCLNGATRDKIERDFKHFTAYQDAAHPGGYEQANVDFVMDFDCRLIDAPAAQ